MQLSADIQNKITGKNIVVFDGICVLCNGWIKFLLKFDTYSRFHFVIAQSDLGEDIYQSLGLKSADYETFIVITDNQLHTKLDGVFALFKTLGGFWSVLSVGRFLPRFLKDPAYDIVAKNRYRLFGKRDTCIMPTPDIQARFLS